MKDNWLIYPDAKLNSNGSEISSAGFNADNWYRTEVPKTVFATLVDNGIYKNPYFGLNMNNFLKDDFKNPWWYRTEVYLDEINRTDVYQLIFEGINYKAELWVNGNRLSPADSFEGAFGIFEFNITEVVKKGSNFIAVKIYPPVTGDLTIGFVDWNPEPPDHNMGIWRPVKLKKTSLVSMDNVFIQPKLNVETLAEAELKITADLTNHSDKIVSGTIVGSIENIIFSKKFEIDPLQKIDVEINADQVPGLKIKNPRIWWPNNLGEPNLYNLDIKILINENISDRQDIRFGIRDVKDFINENGHRGYMINGKKLVIKGAGWVDDLMLNDSDEKVIRQVEYAKHMNLNTLRLEGFWGRNKTLYDAADEFGILIMIGWSCQWEWEGYCGRKETEYMCIDTPRDINLQSDAYIDQVKWLRNHPSVFLWVLGSDKLPLPELEKKMLDLLKVYDPTRSVLSTCKGPDANGYGNMSTVSGNPGVKMLGPYDYVPPIYWYVDTLNGGAYGFNTETGPGPQVPPIESIKKMIPEENLWPIDDVWNYHCGRNEFGRLDRYVAALDNRYGKSNTLEEFVSKSQMSNYEAMRPMFEAFRVNKFNSTGVIQWMFNSAWPEMFWQLFDHYLMPNGAFYGAKKGCQQLSLIYNYKDKNIYAVNDYNRSFEKLNASVKIFDADSKILYETAKNFNINENCSIKLLELPKINNSTGILFICLELYDPETKITDDNFYWISSKDDVMDFENSEWFYTPIKSHADLKKINSIPSTEIKYEYEYRHDSGKGILEVTLSNDTDFLAFLLELVVVDEKSGDTVLPIFWDDNYFSMLPKSERKLTGYFYDESKEINPVLKLRGWNIK